jgi:hypothetical protein
MCTCKCCRTVAGHCSRRARHLRNAGPRGERLGALSARLVDQRGGVAASRLCSSVAGERVQQQVPVADTCNVTFFPGLRRAGTVRRLPVTSHAQMAWLADSGRREREWRRGRATRGCPRPARRLSAGRRTALSVRVGGRTPGVAFHHRGCRRHREHDRAGPTAGNSPGRARCRFAGSSPSASAWSQPRTEPIGDVLSAARAAGARWCSAGGEPGPGGYAGPARQEAGSEWMTTISRCGT